MDPEERPRDPTMNITDNPAFSFDEYDVIPGQYLNNNKPSVLPKRGSLGKIKKKKFPEKRNPCKYPSPITRSNHA